LRVYLKKLSIKYFEVKGFMDNIELNELSNYCMRIIKRKPNTYKIEEKAFKSFYEFVRKKNKK
jgi:predicted DNA-binding protein (UPF0278 family)